MSLWEQLPRDSLCWPKPLEFRQNKRNERNTFFVETSTTPQHLTDCPVLFPSGLEDSSCPQCHYYGDQPLPHYYGNQPLPHCRPQTNGMVPTTCTCTCLCLHGFNPLEIDLHKAVCYISVNKTSPTSSTFSTTCCVCIILHPIAAFAIKISSACVPLHIGVVPNCRYLHHMTWQQ